MQRSRRFLITWLLLAAALTAGFVNGAAAASLQSVINTGTLRVGIVLAAPWALRTDAGALTGFEVDVAEKLALDMGVEAEFVVYEFDELVPALEAGEIDLVAAGLSITPERALHVNFSQSYAIGGIGLASNVRATATIERLEMLSDPDYTVAALRNSVASELADRVLPRATLELFDSEQEAADALLSGRVDAYLDNEPVPTFLALEHPQLIDVPMTRPLLETRSAFAVNKGDPDFVFYLNAWISAREADTWLPSTHQYWFESLRWRE